MWAVFADTHPNSKRGLCHPDGHAYDDEGSYVPGKSQLWLWRRWETDFWGHVGELKRKLKAEVWSIQVGDGCDDNRHSRHGLITANKSGVIDIAEAIHEPALRHPKYGKVADLFFGIRGTDAHVGRQGELEELLFKGLESKGAVVVPDEFKGTKTWWWAPLEAYGVVGDFAHRPGSNSTRPWTLGGGAIRQAAILKSDWNDRGKPMPRYAWRAHFHHLEDTGYTHVPRTMFCPPWQLRTAFGERIGYSGRLEKVGGWIAIMHPDGESKVYPLLWSPPERPIWMRELWLWKK